MHQERTFWKGAALSGHARTHASELRKLQNGFCAYENPYVSRSTMFFSSVGSLYYFSIL